MNDARTHSPRRLRLSRQRATILRVLQGLCSHPTADELHRLVRQELPHVSLGTVYRNLDVLCEQGLAVRLDGGGGQRRYDGRVQAHYHARCVRCGGLVDVPEGLTPKIDLRLSESLGFEVTECRLEILGVCRACAQREARPATKRSTAAESAG